MGKQYELTTIHKLTVDDITGEFEVSGVENLLRDLGVKVLKHDILGVKRLAYPIQEHTYGGYDEYTLDLDEDTAQETCRKIESGMKNIDTNLRWLLVSVAPIEL